MPAREPEAIFRHMYGALPPHLAEQMAEWLRTAGLNAVPLSREGDPAETIVAFAEAHEVDLIVLGTHGRTGLRRLLLGSVARNVTLHAHCSVLVAR